MSVRPSVCLSVTRRYCIETAKHILKQLFQPHHSSISTTNGMATGASNAGGGGIKNKLHCNLHNICLLESALLCKDVMCNNSQHAHLMEKYANDIIPCCLFAAFSSIPRTSPRANNRVIPGWVDYVAPARKKSIYWHNIWLECGCPLAS